MDFTRGWLCKTTSDEGSAFITRRAEEKRYRDLLRRIAEQNLVTVECYTCKGGDVFALLTGTDYMGAKKVIRSVNASYGKYKRLQGEDAAIVESEPLAVNSSEEYMSVLLEIFPILHVADMAGKDV